jgi:hypothetical protein
LFKIFLTVEFNLVVYITTKLGQVRISGIAACCRLDGYGIEAQWRREIQHPSRLALEPTSLLYSGYWIIPWGKAVRAWH